MSKTHRFDPRVLGRMPNVYEPRSFPYSGGDYYQASVPVDAFATDLRGTLLVKEDPERPGLMYVTARSRFRPRVHVDPECGSWEYARDRLEEMRVTNRPPDDWLGEHELGLEAELMDLPPRVVDTMLKAHERDRRRFPYPAFKCLQFKSLTVYRRLT